MHSKICVKLLFRSCFKTFFVCTFNASNVTSINFLLEWQIACSFCRKTVWTDDKFWMVGFFENPNPNRISVFCKFLLVMHGISYDINALPPQCEWALAAHLLISYYAFKHFIKKCDYKTNHFTSNGRHDKKLSCHSQWIFC